MPKKKTYNGPARIWIGATIVEPGKWKAADIQNKLKLFPSLKKYFAIAKNEEFGNEGENGGADQPAPAVPK